MRRITSWMLRHPDNLTDDDQSDGGRFSPAAHTSKATAGHVNSFAEILTGRLGEQLNSWMSAISTDDLPRSCIASFEGSTPTTLRS
ncbi:hypothetical protein FFI94_016280 [Rhodococcus sp. KBS0724]|uniref:hypothetical protein n=1 Tax=Rhodococcus sp. KBS0724 TaxID=1179674 RepID=UPI00110E8D91|nr:hypothetical protein [Rhodococcus sp. KBS0724]TSD47538.1 hypothetical protein FFI94_016280 [Rhodococcus sp. KBS0724]